MSERNPATWHEKHRAKLTLGDRLADDVAAGMGSWAFIIIQTLIVICWITLNLVGFYLKWDPYPFILLNLLFSTQAAYAAPIIMQSQHRQSERDRVQALEDFETNVKAKKEIEDLQKRLARIEDEKLSKILELLEKGR